MDIIKKTSKLLNSVIQAKQRIQASWVLKRSLFLILGILMMVILLLPSTLFRHPTAKPPQTHSSKIPISTAPVTRGNVGIYVSGLGTVTPLNTVQVFSRVQGQILKVSYQEGQRVHPGDALIDIDPRPYEAALLQAEGQLQRDQAVLKQARMNLRRYQKAYLNRAIPKQQLDDQNQLVYQLEGTLRADQGLVDNAQVNLSYCHITSPIEGRVGLRLIDEGNIIPVNSLNPLVLITQVQPITVIFSVAEDDLPMIQNRLHSGHSNDLIVDVFDRSQEKKLATGNFLSLDNLIDPNTGTIRIRAKFSNEKRELFPNQFVNARLLVETQENVEVVPHLAIQRNSQGSFLYVINSQQTAELRPVQVGPTEGEFTAVSDVRLGEFVATSGFDQLQNGSPVEIRTEKQMGGSQGHK